MTREAVQRMTRRVGDYVVSVAVEEAEGTWQTVDGRLAWRDPETENCHIEIAVRSGADGRFLPGLRVNVTLADSEGRELGSHDQPFHWHPWLYRYGRNWTVPEAGTYRVRVRIEPPELLRHDREGGYRFVDPVEIEFDEVEIEPARKSPSHAEAPPAPTGAVSLNTALSSQRPRRSRR